MTDRTIDVTGTGAVVLTEDLACDGFHYPCTGRVQTHVHDDHMDGFETSKGFQHIYATPPTKELLVADLNADLGYRSNLLSVPYREWRTHGNTRFMLLENGHMLGSAQVVAESASGYRSGYSGDFSWPVNDTIKVDTLILDSTCGDPKLVRRYTQQDAEDALVRIVRKAVPQGPVFIKASRGTVQRALMAVTGNLDCPLLGSKRLLKETDVYRKYGQPIEPIVDADSSQGRDCVRSERYVRFFGRGDRLPVDTSRATVIVLNAYVPSHTPYVEHSERSYTVALSNHADFEETLEYVKSTGARQVITDHTRSAHAPQLARELTTRLGVRAIPSSSLNTREWGG